MERISSGVSSKSKTLKFSAMRSGRTDFGIATTPRCVNQRMITCAIVLPCCSPIDRSSAFLKMSFLYGRHRVETTAGKIGADVSLLFDFPHGPLQRTERGDESHRSACDSEHPSCTPFHR